MLLLPLLATGAAAASQPPGLAPFNRLVGHCWEGQVADGATDVHCFEQLYGDAHVVDRHAVMVKGAAVYEGETFYSRDGPKLTFVYLNSQGGVGHGEAVPSDTGICFTGDMRGTPQGAPQPISLCWRWQQDGSYLADSGNGKPVRFVLSRRHI